MLQLPTYLHALAYNTTMAEPQKGRIAIKFGGPSTSTQAAKPAPFKAKLPPSTLGKRPRGNSAWGGDDDSDNDENATGKHEAITGFGAEGAESDRLRKEAKKEYVITRQPNRDWKAEAKSQRGGGKDLLPPEARAKRDDKTTTEETEPADQDKKTKWGLTIMEKKKEPADDEDGRTGEETVESGPRDATQLKTEEKTTAPTADEEAMDALLGRKRKAQKTITTSETDAFQRDVRVAGDAPTLEDYEAMPVEEFGAALLRGMGWNGEERTPKRKEVKRRPNKLGLGAKELKEAEDLGGWNQNGAKKKRPTLSEYRREEERKKESRRNDDGDKRESERHRDGDRHRDRDRDKDSDRDRHRHRDRNDDRHRHRDRHRR